MARSTQAKKFDKLYKAIGSGERTSKKFATIKMTDGSSFKRRNANQYGEAEGGNDYTEKRVNRTDKYTPEGKVIAKRGATIGRSSEAKAFDKMYKAIGAGERTSKKFATIKMTDGHSFKRRNANQYGPAQGDLDYTETRVNRTDKYTKDGKVIAKNGATIGRSSTAKNLDKKYKAIGAGERTSKKFATIRMTDGHSFKRRNANQFGPAQGDLDYTEKRVNRTDKYTKDGKVIAQDGAFIETPSNETPSVAFVYEIGGL
jgi:azurin